MTDARFRGVVAAKDGKVLLGGLRRVRSVWFNTYAEAAGWVTAMVEGQENSVGYTNVLTWRANKFTERYRP